jgi:uncharacterized delta-60 repeat protein
MKVFISTVLALLVISSFAYSQGVYQQWVSRYNGSGNFFDGANAMTSDNSGNIYVCGSSFQSTTSRDMLVIKFTPAGNIAWIRTFNGIHNAGDYAFDVTVDVSGNVYMTGRCDNGLPTLSDYTTVKYNSSGVLQWSATYNGPVDGIDEATAVRIDNSGNVYVTGKSPGTGTNLDIVTVKYNSSGVEQWVQRINGTANSIDYPTSMALTSTGDVVVAGTLLNTGAGADFAVIKYSSSGTQLWFAVHNNPVINGGDLAKSVEVDASDNIIACGFTDNGFNVSQSKYDFLTIKYNSNGVQQWLANYNGAANSSDFANDLAVDLNGNVYVTGGTYVSLLADSNFITIKYSPTGTQLWVAHYNGTGSASDVARTITVDAQGNAYITGGSVGPTMDDYATVKYNTGGQMQWVMRYNGPGNQNDFTNSIVVTDMGEAYVTGKSVGSGTDYDIATIKYAPLVGINPVNNEIPNTYALNQNYPNPFNPTTIISFDIPKDGNAILKIHDINGRNVSTPVNENLKAGKYNITFNAVNLPSGVYFYTLSTNSFTNTKKMILIK